MLDLSLIENTIQELENGETNFATCERLASLYIIREHHKPTQQVECDTVKKELSDILPHYDMYCALKRQYQLHFIDKVPVVQAFADVLTELKEFIHILYSSTDMEDERELIIKMLNTLEL